MSSEFTWYLGGRPYAISHALQPLYSIALFHPAGDYPLSNTSEVAFGVALAPATWLFGPATSLNGAHLEPGSLGPGHVRVTAALNGVGSGCVLRRLVPEIGEIPCTFIGLKSQVGHAQSARGIRQAPAGWGVTTVVVPEQSEMPSYDSGRPVPYAVGLFTAALGQPPILESKAWVWNNVRHAPPAMAVSPSEFAACIGGNGSQSTALAVAACVLHRR